MIPMRTGAFIIVPMLLLAACASQPLGPTVTVLPAPGKPFDVFQGDQALCKDYAEGQVAGGAQRANNSQVLTGIVGTVLGAGLGAAIGGGRGAAIGAGAGALGGTAVGAGPSAQAQGSLQDRYNTAYLQCMYSRGNQLPGYAAPPPPPAYEPRSGYGQPAYGQPGGYGQPYR